MLTEPVLSKTISRMGWENDNLQVEFPNGKIYLYSGVTLQEWQQIRVSPSKGKSLHSLVIAPGKEYKRIK